MRCRSFKKQLRSKSPPRQNASRGVKANSGLKPFSVVVVCCGACALSAAQVCHAPVDTPSKTQESKPIEIGIIVHGGGAFVPVLMNDGKTYSFLLDTGFEDSVLDPSTVAALQLKTVDRRTDAGPGGKVETETVIGVQRRVGGIRLSKSSLTVLDLSGFAPFFGHRLDGILGYDFLSQFVVILDYQHQKLTLCDPPSFRDTAGHFEAVNLQQKQRYVKAIIEGQNGNSAPAFIEIDTGKLDPFSLNAAFARSHDLLGGSSKTLAFQGVGVGGGTQAWLTRTRTLRVAGFDFINPLVAIAEDNLDRLGNQRPGAVGYGLLKQFLITFDYSRGEIALQRIKNAEMSFEFDHAGFVLGSTGPNFDTLTAVMVIVQTPAAKAGIMPGDEIVEIDGRPAKNYTLDQARDYFAHAVGERTLRIKRNGALKTVKVTCRRLV